MKAIISADERYFRLTVAKLKPRSNIAAGHYCFRSLEHLQYV
jgi:hypothetical protein